MFDDIKTWLKEHFGKISAGVVAVGVGVFFVSIDGQKNLMAYEYGNFDKCPWRAPIQESLHDKGVSAVAFRLSTFKDSVIYTSKILPCHTLTDTTGDVWLEPKDQAWKPDSIRVIELEWKKYRSKDTAISIATVVNGPDILETKTVDFYRLEPEKRKTWAVPAEYKMKLSTKKQNIHMARARRVAP